MGLVEYLGQTSIESDVCHFVYITRLTRIVSTTIETYMENTNRHEHDAHHTAFFPKYSLTLLINRAE